MAKKAWTPYVNAEIFIQTGEREWTNRITGEALNNPLTVQILSYDYDRQNRGVATEKQQGLLKKFGLSTTDVAKYRKEQKESDLARLQEEQKQWRELLGSQERKKSTIASALEYDPSTPLEMVQWEQAYINFITNLRDLTNDPLTEMVIQKLDKLGSAKWELGIALNDMPDDILYYVGYGGYIDSDGAIEAFATRVIEYLPIPDEDKAELEDQLDALSFEDLEIDY